jgi:branched-chain amino acid transport system substrate-binding protein
MCKAANFCLKHTQTTRPNDRNDGIVSQPEIRAGVSISTSGKFQPLGQQALNGLLLWKSYMNREGGIPVGGSSRPVRLIWYDDGGRSDRTRENVHRLLQNDCVDIFFGPYSSNLTMVAAKIAEEHKKLLWSYGGTSDEIFSRASQYIIGISSPASDYFRALPPWLAKEYPDIRRLCVLYSGKGSFGRQVSRGVLESAREIGHSVDSVPLNDADPDQAISTLHKLNPEAVVLAAGFQDELAIMQTRSRWPNTVRATAAVSAGIPDFGSHLGEASEGVIGASQWEPGGSHPGILGPTSACFVNHFGKQFGTTPDYVAAGSFATGLIVGECIRRADSLDFYSLRSAASQLECSTFYGRFRINSQSGKQIGHRILLVHWQNGSKIFL